MLARCKTRRIGLADGDPATASLEIEHSGRSACEQMFSGGILKVWA